MWLPRALKNVRKACFLAGKVYVPQVHSGRVTLFRASEKSLGGLEDAEAGLSEWAGRGLEIHEIAAGHGSMLVEPQVRALAEELRACLDKAQSRHLLARPASPLS